VRDDELGIRPDITRRDFLGTTLLGTGATLLAGASPLELLRRRRRGAADVAGAEGASPGARALPGADEAARRSLGQEADPWWGWGAVGDYADSAGNTRAVMEAAHRIRDGAYDPLPAGIIDTGEEVDLAIVGGGMSGLGAALHFRDIVPTGRCVVLDNHPIFGGEAKENEFLVDGVRLVGPQGSNDFGVPTRGSGSIADVFFERMGLPRDFEYVEPAPSVSHLKFSLDSYAPMTGVAETEVDVGYWFGGGRWVANMWRDGLERARYPEGVRRGLLRWRDSTGSADEAFQRRLDATTYAGWLEGEMGLPPEVTAYADPIIGLINGVSPDAASAFAAAQIGMPGVTARARSGSLPHSFPGGNTVFGRAIVKALIPDAIEGEGLDGVANGRVRFAALDRPGQRTRIRLGATVLDVRHVGMGPDERVRVIYEVGGRLYSLRAKQLVLASGGWVNRRIVADLPPEIAAAYDEFHHAPALVANVALTNWRFLAELGFTACRWLGDGAPPEAPGFCASIRQPMVVGDYRAPLDPEQPIVLTLYQGLATPGLSVQEQGAAGRTRLVEMTFYDYERRLRAHLLDMFADAGLDPGRDIAGIVLNRWGHARLAQQPGFYFGTNGRPSPREVVEKAFGRVAIGHSELNGHQNWTGGLARGRAAVEKLFPGL